MSAIDHRPREQVTSARGAIADAAHTSQVSLVLLSYNSTDDNSNRWGDGARAAWMTSSG
jgi:hypothetical protein